jgi:hypothetical protein
MKKQAFILCLFSFFAIISSCKKQEIEVIPTSTEEDEIPDTVTLTIGELITGQDHLVGILISDQSGKIIFDSIAPENRPSEDWVISYPKRKTDTVALTTIRYWNVNTTNKFTNRTYVNPVDGMFLEFPSFQPNYGPLRDYHFKIAGISSIEEYAFPGTLYQNQIDINIENDTAEIAYRGILGLDQMLLLKANMNPDKRLYYANSTGGNTDFAINWSDFSNNIETQKITMPFSAVWLGDIFAVNQATGNWTCILYNDNLNSPPYSTIEVDLPSGLQLTDYNFQVRSYENSMGNISTNFSTKYETLPSSITLDFDPVFELVHSDSKLEMLFGGDQADFYTVNYYYQYRFHGEEVGGSWEVYGNAAHPPNIVFPEIPEAFFDKMPYLEPIAFPRKGRIAFYQIKPSFKASLAENPLNLFVPEWSMNASSTRKEYPFER